MAIDNSGSDAGTDCGTDPEMPELEKVPLAVSLRPNTELVLTLNLHSAQSHGDCISASCVNLAGDEIAVLSFNEEDVIAQVRTRLADTLVVRPDRLRLVLPNSVLLTEREEGMKLRTFLA
mmetsp:Transcript_85115/g.197912  ORF Transcript_85115/g.197912 Transcript_85115/m.197912 type:complete len:120 (+) Transcript_85115:62-421(+)